MKITIVSYYFPPSTAVGARRVHSLWRFLRERGCEVDVLSANWIGAHLPGVTYLGSAVTYGSSARGAVTGRWPWLEIGKYVRSLDRSLGSSFMISALRYVAGMTRPSSGRRVVIASYRPIASVVIGLCVARITRGALIVELRDLVSRFGRKRRVPVLDVVDQFIDRLVVGSAEAIVAVSPTAQQYAATFYRRSVELIPNGVDRLADCEGARGPLGDDTTIFYSGELSEARRLDKVSRHVLQYMAIRKLRIVVASRDNPMAFGADPLVTEWVGHLPHTDVQRLQQQARFLLILEGTDADSVENVPAKLFEYLGACRPIMADCHPGSDIVRIITECRRGSLIDSFDQFRQCVEAQWSLSSQDVAPYLRGVQNLKYMDLITRVAPTQPSI